MKWLRSLVVTGGLSVILSIVTMGTLMMLFNDVLKSSWILILVDPFITSAYLVKLFLTAFIPIYHVNENDFQRYTPMELYKNFLPIALLPLSVFIGILFACNSNINKLLKADSIIIYINLYLKTFISTWIFIKTMASHVIPAQAGISTMGSTNS